ncbi:condensin subunit Smc [Sporobacter termitidis DSM 10068]|uniref:Chromosome partition protein Smc n=1 Tax=Sporobacter termitidis DSM 10068 TaxID=1123282 RepID=A0A1M5UKJ5_9FIRM|nr:condensin subunit Smc [Sporobacter termitidis DSM 10068]
MYLKSLEIQGFKSFPEKTRLTFDKPVTAIVGPNGSGKSNISDAILWVMGEQSTRTLRGGKMEDVIFGGTQKRPQLGFAEVSLILDNADHTLDTEFTEVMITRRYYRSGESEYFINRQMVRLKDVNELFMDTGLGREGYSIIGQGRIDAILSIKSTDRREIFEEAAGISRFRHRKEESERKLEHTEENLVRLGDKISELYLQVEPLQKQAETAKKYLLLRDELRGLEISVWMDSLDGLQEQITKTETDYLTALSQKDDVSREIDSYYETSLTFSDKMHEKDVELESVREAVSAQEAQIAEIDSATAVLKANLESNIGESERIRRELTEQEGRDGGIKAQIDERELRLGEISAEKAALSADSARLVGALQSIADTAGESSKRLGDMLSRENTLQEEISEAKSRLSALASKAQEILDRDGTVALDAAAAGEKHRQLEEDMSACADELDAAGDELQRIKNVITGYTMRRDSRKKKADAANDKKMHLTMELNSLKSRIRLLTEMEKDYQGYSKAVKLVMQESQRGILKHVHGTVGSLVQTDDKYAVAIETALGGAMQNIIVDTEEDGKEAINLLKRRDGGRATFLPISTVRGNVLDVPGLKNEPGYEGLAIDLVRSDGRYAGIYRSLLGRVAVAGSLDDAIRIARRHNNSFRIVTLDGQVLNAGGSMTGGSSSSNTGILSRANELKGLSEQEALLAESAARAEREHGEAVRELTASEYELESSGAEMRSLEDKVLKLDTNLRHFEALVSASAENLNAMRAEAENLAERIKANGDETAAARNDIAALESALSELRAQIARDTEGQEQLTSERDRITSALSELRAREASLDAENEALTKAVTELSELREILTGGRRQQMQYLDELKARHDAILKEISDNETALVQLGEKMAAFRARSAAITAEKLELEAARTRRDKVMQEKNHELLELERECARLEQKKLAAQMEEKQIIDRLWDSYEITRSVALTVRQELENPAEARRHISELKRDISSLGTPNIGAIEEFERVNTRYTYLTEQRDDVEKAKRELQEIIRDITQEMRTMFAREFENISLSFKETFLEFFGGGQASLELEDPNDILNCGIEIKVQPPGKALKTITLLSGGEKAFVASALYFSILKVRPTPFVVMDEIDAALDEANVLRFAENMRKMSVKTQMIVITHHRGTMEEADVLYGVTMQEQGVSRVLSIDLAEAEKTLKKDAS